LNAVRQFVSVRSGEHVVVAERSGAKPIKDLTRLQTQPLSRAGRKIADAIMETAKFKRTTDGTRLVRQYEVHGIVVTEWISAENFAGIRS
jgi:hypothetical protein